jgi:hypothetical protein
MYKNVHRTEIRGDSNVYQQYNGFIILYLHIRILYHKENEPESHTVQMDLMKN